MTRSVPSTNLPPCSLAINPHFSLLHLELSPIFLKDYLSILLQNPTVIILFYKVLLTIFNLYIYFFK